MSKYYPKNCLDAYVAFFIFRSVSNMTSLKQLDLSDNDLSRDERLSDKLSALTNLEILYLSCCSLKKIPDRYVSDNLLVLLLYELMLG